MPNPWELEQEQAAPPWELPQEPKPTVTGAIKGAVNNLEDVAARAAGLDPGVNYRLAESGNVTLPGANPFMNLGASIANRLPDLWTRFQLGRADKPSETEKYLDNKFGPKNWAKVGDRYVLKPEVARKAGYKVAGDQPVAVNPFGPDLGDVAEFMGSAAGPLAGGLAAGALTGGAGFIPGVIAAGIGGAVGEAGQEALKRAEGFSDKTTHELAADIGAEGLSSMAGEGVFRLATPALSRLLGPHTRRAFTPGTVFGKRAPLESTINPEVLAKTQEALRKGMVPSVPTATDKNLLGRLQTAAEYIFGSPREAVNKKAIIDARNELAYRANPYPMTGAPAWGEKELISGAPQEFVEKAGRDVSKATAEDLLSADAVAKAAEDRFQQKIYEGFAKPDPNVGEQLKTALNANIKAFYSQAREGYAVYDDMVKGASINLDGVKGVAKDWLESAPVKTTAAGEKTPIQQGSEESLSFLRNIAGMDTMQQAKAALSLRTALSSSIDQRGLPGVPDHIRRQMVKAIDQSFDDAAEQGVVAPEASAYLKNLRGWYKDNIEKFNAKEVQRLLVDPSSAGNVPADRVIDFVSSLKSGDQVLRLKAALPGDIWKKVQRGAWDGLLEDVSSPDKVVSAKALSKAVRDKQDWLVGVFGKEKADQISTYANYLSTRGGGVTLDNLGKGDPYTVLRNAAARQQGLDEEWSAVKNVSEIVTRRDPTDLIPSMLKGSGSGPMKIEQLKNFLGENSDAWRQFRAGAMEHVLRPLVKQSDNAVSAVLNPAALRESLSEYNASALQAVFGKDLYKDLIGFADLAKFTTSRKTGFAGNIVAATIAMHPLSNLGVLAKFNLMGKIMAKPGFVRYITTGVKDGWTRDSLRMLARATAQIATPDISPETAASLVE